MDQTRSTEKLRKHAWDAHNQGKLSLAEKSYKLLLENGNSKGIPDVRDAINLGALYRAQGRLKEATNHYSFYIKIFPENHHLRLNGINMLFDAQEIDLVKDWISYGLEINKENTDYKKALAKFNLIKGELKESRNILEEIIKYNPKDETALLDYGYVCNKQKDFEEAINAYNKVININPNEPKAIANLITITKKKGDLKQANQIIKSIKREIKDHKLIQASIAALWIEENRFIEAESILSHLCNKDPEESQHWLNRAACLRSEKIIIKGTKIIKEGIKWCPQNSDLMQALAQSLAEIGQHESSIRAIMRSNLESKEIIDSHVFNIQFIGAGYNLINSFERKELALKWESKKCKDGVGNLWGDHYLEKIESRRLRVGYLSADFANHPVGRFILPILKNHCKDKVEIWGLNCTKNKVDGISENIKEACDHWVDVRYGSDLEAARLIGDHKLDIIIELGGFTGYSRLGIMTHKPAPIQLSYLGYYAPTYIKAIDGWIGDKKLFESLNEIDKSSQTIINIDGGYMAFSPENLPNIVENSNREFFRFGSFNNSRKLTKESIKLFCEIMANCPKSELVLKSISFVEKEEQVRIRGLFEKEGLNNERLIILPWVEGWENHMELYKEIDIGLDPIPYGGATTSCESLAMGVPVISLAGEGMVGRLTSSILYYADFKEFIANNTEEYISIASNISKKGIRGKKERISTRNQLFQSQLGDPKRLSHELEQSYFQLLNSKR